MCFIQSFIIIYFFIIVGLYPFFIKSKFIINLAVLPFVNNFLILLSLIFYFWTASPVVIYSMLSLIPFLPSLVCVRHKFFMQIYLYYFSTLLLLCNYTVFGGIYQCLYPECDSILLISILFYPLNTFYFSLSISFLIFFAYTNIELNLEVK